ncbi:MAG: hypothetical protein CBE26_01530 [Kiritimatiellaceae bacterium TMED266]|jgi:hypothetical protein|nr:MAG: hypothetical protein CBE26_01530 [Kiritimatiellaceae bacterium TMED266]
MFDVARYLSYSNSVDHARGAGKLFSFKGSDVGLGQLLGVSQDGALNGKHGLHAEPGKGL